MRVRTLGLVPYAETAAAMQAFTAGRDAHAEDELWLCEHPPVFTQGLAGRPEHVLLAGSIPVVATNRGGQVTYHGPGQVVAYPLVDLRRLGLFVKEYVYRLETAVIQSLAHWGVSGHRVRGAPGIYVRLADPGSHAVLEPCPAGENPFAGLGKIAALGLKVSRHCSYHGLALNVEMDLEPFSRIHPCGYAGLATVDLARLGRRVTWAEAASLLATRLELLLQASP
jgi:lipoyl(octanoyl) transferase